MIFSESLTKNCWGLTGKKSQKSVNIVFEQHLCMAGGVRGNMGTRAPPVEQQKVSKICPSDMAIQHHAPLKMAPCFFLAYGKPSFQQNSSD